MRNVIGVLVMIMCLFATSAFAGIFGQEELRNVDAGYEIDTWGSNSEVYEFTPKTAPWKICVVYLPDNLKSSSMQCFDKANAEEIKKKYMSK